ncbi:MAG: DinB family protein [candidate division Zixibacteria bacterium]|nr:DinB family protein [candidate division Zixibacteria bacterium]
MREHLMDLLQFNNWANKRIFTALPGVADHDPQTVVLLSHVVIAELLWLDRVNGIVRPLPLWEPLPFPELLRLIDQSTHDWLSYVGDCDATRLERRVAYVNTKGVSYQNSVREIATHLVNHGSHHRGQIVQLIRRTGATPPLVDFIAYARNE